MTEYFKILGAVGFGHFWQGPISCLPANACGKCLGQLMGHFLLHPLSISLAQSLQNKTSFLMLFFTFFTTGNSRIWVSFWRIIGRTEARSQDWKRSLLWRHRQEKQQSASNVLISAFESIYLSITMTKLEVNRALHEQSNLKFYTRQIMSFAIGKTEEYLLESSCRLAVEAIICCRLCWGHNILSWI